MKKMWDKLLQTSTALAAILAFTICGIFCMLVVAIVVVVTKILVFIK
jgi:hypothetical protein